MRSRARIAVVVALVAAAWLVFRGVDRPPAPDAPAPRREVAPARAAVRVVPDPHTEELPGVHCWDGLLAVDRAGSMADLHALLGRAVTSGDDLLATYLGDRLAELIGDDPARAAELLDWAEAADGRELEVLLGALARTAAVQRPEIAARLLRAGGRADAGEVRRSAALAALDTQHALAAGSIDRLHAIALEADAGAAAWTATRTLGRVMANDFERTGSYQPYWDPLLDIARTTRDPAVRVLALEMPAYSDPVLGAAYIDDLADVLSSAPEPEVREMAAFQLGLTEDPDRVLGVFRAAFPREHELCVRWAIVRFSVRAAGPRALPLLDELVRIDPRFREDRDDFARIYATGVQDFERVWLDKVEHHACTSDGDEGEGAS